MCVFVCVDWLTMCKWVCVCSCVLLVWLISEVVPHNPKSACISVCGLDGQKPQKTKRRHTFKIMFIFVYLLPSKVLQYVQFLSFVDLNFLSWLFFFFFCFSSTLTFESLSISSIIWLNYFHVEKKVLCHVSVYLDFLCCSQLGREVNVELLRHDSKDTL